jgi:transcription termination factor Rho
MREMKLKELQQKSPTELLAFAEENEVENASTMRKQDLKFAMASRSKLRSATRPRRVR